MDLRGCPLLYVFLETCDLPGQRAFLERVVHLRVIELDTGRGVRHGVVKYDAGSLVLSVNLSSAHRFGQGASDGLTTVFAGGHTLRTDASGHHYVLGSHPPAVAELRLQVDDPDVATSFYRELLGLELVYSTGDVSRFATGSVPIVLDNGPRAVDQRLVRHDTYLLVFHTPHIHETRESLAARGVRFTGRRVRTSEIGSTIRFADPSGHRFCLYEPSPTALAWPSGQTVRGLVESGS